MKIYKLLKLIFTLSALMTLLLLGCTQSQKTLPAGFVFLRDIDPSIVESVRYSTNKNFLGRPVIGYTTKGIVCTKDAAKALKIAHEELKKQGYTLVVYDAYRPQRAVDEFVRWAKDLNDSEAKSLYYPNVDKRDLFKLDYIAEKSGHTRGSTFDLTIIESNKKLSEIKITHRKLSSGEEIPYLDDNTVDMGSSFDLFHLASHHDSPLINKHHTKMRNVLRETMKKNGFKEYKQEWWHYTLANEPYPDTYFDFVV